MLRNRHKDALVVLLELTRKLADQTTLELALSAVTDATIEIIGADHASIRLLDASHSELLSGARSGAGTTRRPMTFRKGQGVLGWVVEYKEPIVIDDARIDPRFVAQPAQGFNVVSLIAEPMWSAGAVIGVLSGSSPRERAFGPDDQLLMRLLANCSTPPTPAPARADGRSHARLQPALPVSSLQRGDRAREANRPTAQRADARSRSLQDGQ